MLSGTVKHSKGRIFISTAALPLQAGNGVQDMWIQGDVKHCRFPVLPWSCLRTAHLGQGPDFGCVRSVPQARHSLTLADALIEIGTYEAKGSTGIQTYGIDRKTPAIPFGSLKILSWAHSVSKPGRALPPLLHLHHWALCPEVQQGPGLLQKSQDVWRLLAVSYARENQKHSL